MQLFEMATGLLQTEVAGDLKICNSVFSLIAEVYAFSPAALETISQFDFNQLAKIFPRYIEFQPIMKNDPVFAQNADQLQELVTQTATNCDLSPDFIDILRKCFMNYYTTDDPEVLVCFLQKIQACAEIPECHTAIAYLFEAMIEIDYLNLDPEKVEMLWQIIQFAAEFAESLITGDSVSDLQFGLASFIWSEIMDYEIDELEVPDELKQQLFQHFNQSLTIFVQDVDEFYNLIYIGTNKYNALITSGHEEFWEEIYQFLDIIIEISNSVEDILCPAFAKAIFDLTDLDKQQFENYSKNLIDYFLSKVAEPSNGIFYAVASTTPLMRMHIAQPFAALLPTLDTLDCIVYFIEKCAIFAPEQVEIYVQVLFTTFQEDPSVVNARIIRKFMGAFMKYFVENSSDVVQPLLEWIPEVEPNVNAQLINGVMSLSIFLGMEEADLNSLLSGMLDLIQSSATTILGEGSEEEVNYLNVYVNDLFFPSPMQTKPGENTYIPPPETIVEFCSQAVSRIFDVIGGLWTAEDDDIQEGLCKIITKVMKSNWIQDISIVGNWIESVLPINPVAGHIMLLRQIWMHESAQTENIIGFLNSLPELSESPSLQILILQLFTKLTSKWTANFYEKIDLGAVIPTLSSDNEMVVTNSLELALSIVQTSEDTAFSEAVLPVIRDCLFTKYPLSIWEMALHVVFEIASSRIEPATVIAVLFEPISFRDESTAKIEEILTAAPEIGKDDVIDAIRAMAAELSNIVEQFKAMQSAPQ